VALALEAPKKVVATRKEMEKDKILTAPDNTALLGIFY